MRTTPTIVDSSSFPASYTCGIQEAIDSLGETGGKVLIPAGSYELRRAVRLPSRVLLCGEGEATILTRPPLVVLSFTADTNHCNSLEVKDWNGAGIRIGDQLRIMDDAQVMYHSREILVTIVQHNHIEGELIYGEGDRIYRVSQNAWVANLFPAITSHRTEGVAIADLAIDGGEYSYADPYHGDFLGAGIHTFKVRSLRIRDVSVRRWPADGISVQGGDAIVTGCIVQQCAGSALHPGSALRQSVWANNMASRNRHGLFFCSTVTDTATGLNVLTGNQENGIWGLGDPDMGNTVIGSICAENGSHGIEAERANGNAVVGNVVRANSQSNAGRFPGVLINQHQNNALVGNTSYDNQTNPTQLRDIVENQALGRNVVAQNHLNADGEK